MIVDDDPAILDAMSFTLKDLGYNVVVGENEKDVKKLSGNPSCLPNLIILDVLLSGEDGRDICKKLKRHTLTKKIPVILTSAHLENTSSAIDAGADAFLSKPFRVNELIKVVQTYIRN